MAAPARRALCRPAEAAPRSSWSSRLRMSPDEPPYGPAAEAAETSRAAQAEAEGRAEACRRRADRRPLPAAGPLRSHGRDLRQAPRDRPLPVGLPAEAAVLFQPSASSTPSRPARRHRPGATNCLQVGALYAARIDPRGSRGAWPASPSASRPTVASIPAAPRLVGREDRDPHRLSRICPTGVKNEDNLAVVIGNGPIRVISCPRIVYGHRGRGRGRPASSPSNSATRKETSSTCAMRTHRRSRACLWHRGKNPGGELAERVGKDKPGDVFIYISSHGMAKEDGNQQDYILPVDGKARTISTRPPIPLQQVLQGRRQGGRPYDHADVGSDLRQQPFPIRSSIRRISPSSRSLPCPTHPCLGLRCSPPPTATSTRSAILSTASVFSPGT